MLRPAALALPFLLSATVAEADQAWCKTLFEDLPADALFVPEVERIAYDEPDLGFAIRYGMTHPEALTVYFYDGGNGDITEAIAEAHFFQGAKDLLLVNKSRAYQPLGKPDFRRIDLGSSYPPLFQMRLISEAESIPVLNDYLIVFGWGNCLTKIRLTSTKPDLAEADTEIVRITDRFLLSLPPYR